MVAAVVAMVAVVTVVTGAATLLHLFHTAAVTTTTTVTTAAATARLSASVFLEVSEKYQNSTTMICIHFGTDKTLLVDMAIDLKLHVPTTRLFTPCLAKQLICSSETPM